MASPDVKGLLQSLLGEGAVPAGRVPRTRSTCSGRSCRRAYSDYFRRHDVSAMVFPTTPLPAAPIGHDETVMLNGAGGADLLHLHPQHAAPAAWPASRASACPPAMTRDGLPVGLELDGPQHADARLLAIARAIEAVLPKTTRRRSLN